jgi:hypothetical protein
MRQNTIISPRYQSSPSPSFPKLRYSVLRWALIAIVTIVVNINISLYVFHYQQAKQQQSVDSTAPTSSLEVDKRIAVLRSELKKLSSYPRHSHSNLPAFTSNGADYVFSSIIELSFDEYGPFVSTFFLSHQMLQAYLINGGGVDRVSPKMRELWKQTAVKFEGMAYEQTGERSGPIKYYCKIANSLYSPTYTVKGRFLPNRLSSDVNSNRRLDVLRCPIRDSRNASNLMRYSDHEIQVEIIADHVSLVKFSIPWKTRRTGYMLSSPPRGCLMDAWRGKPSQPEQNDFPIVHLAMPGTRMLMSKKNLALFLEFVSHHLLIGFDHIYLTVTMNAKGNDMRHLLFALRSYIEDGSLSVTTSSGDGLDSVISSHGLQWHPTATKIFQSTMHLFYTKGFADYLAVFDVDEFFIPKNGYSSIKGIIRAVDLPPGRNPKSGRRQSQGFADEHDHPLCFISVHSEVVANAPVDLGKRQLPWIGSRFAHGSEYNPHGGQNIRYAYNKAIYPTRKMYQAGIVSGGACRLDWQWTPCKNEKTREFCEKGYRVNDNTMESHVDHQFSEVVGASYDGKFLNPWREAVIYHYVIHKDEVSASAESLMNKSEYTAHFFPKVIQDLRQRELDFMLTIQETPSHRYGMPPGKWDKLFTREEIQESQVSQPADHSPMVPIGMTIDSFPPLPKDFLTRQRQRVVDLPDFTVDYKDFVLASMIERESGSYQLYLTTFFLCHSLLEPQPGASAATAISIHPKVTSIWKRAMRVSKSTLYTENGERQQPPHFICKLKYTASSSTEQPISSKGRFVPNRLTPDSNSNRRLDILRCPMEGSENIYHRLEELKNKNEELLVEIYRDSRMIISFRIPWRTRMTGYMLSTPPPSPSPSTAILSSTTVSENAHHPLISTFDPWQNVDMSQPPDQWKHDRLYMCVPGLESAPDKITLPLYLEFIEHHLQLGVDKIFIVASFAWGGRHMQTYLRLLEDYIKEGRVSVQSSSYDGYDFVYSVGGLEWARDNVKNFYVNMCTYLSKGVADYVAVWDFDEFFIPMGKHQNILDVIDDVDISPYSPLPYLHAGIQNISSLQSSWKGGKGLADGDAHPLCFMALTSYVTLREKAWQSEWDYTKPWIGHRFAHGRETSLKEGKGLAFVKTIRPTRVTFQGGLHHIGACRLPSEWDGCDADAERPYGVCYHQAGQIYRDITYENQAISFHSDQHFDELVAAEDAKEIKPSQAYINHVQFHRVWFGATVDALSRRSEYSDQYFSNVFRALDRRGLELPMSLPEKSVFLTRNDKKLLLSTDGWIPSDFLLQPKPASDVDEQASSTTTAADAQELPYMSADGSEVIMAAMIDGGYVSVYFLSHHLLSHESSIDTRNHILGVRRDSSSRWQHFLSPSERHARNQSHFTCSLRNHPDDDPYEVPGIWIDPVIASDQHRPALDLLQCIIHVPVNAEVLDHYQENINRNRFMQVSIKQGTRMLGSFNISWRSRVQTSFLMPLLNGSTSNLKPWLSIFPAGQASPRINCMCMSGYDVTPARQTISLLLESIQHHLLLGLDHIFLSVAFTKQSIHLQRLERILRPFIAQGRLTIYSHAYFGSIDMDYFFGMQGLAWSQEVAMAIQDELCVAFATSFADHVMIWNLHDFLIPGQALLASGSSASPAHNIYEQANLRSILAAAYQRGDMRCVDKVQVNEVYPFAGVMTRYPCHLPIPGQVLHMVSNVDAKNMTVAASNFWTGELYPDGVEGRGMRLPLGDRNKIFRLHANGIVSQSPSSSSNSNKDNVAFSYYLDSNRAANHSSQAQNHGQGKHNQYHQRYFPIVKEHLTQLKYDLMIDIPLRIKPQVMASQLWTNYFRVWDERGGSSTTT